MYLGIEIGGTKLQLGLGEGDGVLLGSWRGTVDPRQGADGIRRQIVAAVPELLSQSGVARDRLRGVGIGFGGPVDDAARTVVKSHQIDGWDNFPLADWISSIVGLPAVLGNDADVAGLAEARFGAGKGLSPVFYVTIGSGIGGGLIVDGNIYRGVGRGAAEIGHLLVPMHAADMASLGDSRRMDSNLGSAGQMAWTTLESVASGWAINERARTVARRRGPETSLLRRLVDDDIAAIQASHVGAAAEQGDRASIAILDHVISQLAYGVCQVIALVCPRRIVIGGGVSLLGDTRLFQPLRAAVAAHVFKPFAACYDIVPAALGEMVVVHGALALARSL